MSQIKLAVSNEKPQTVRISAFYSADCSEDEQNQSWPEKPSFADPIHKVWFKKDSSVLDFELKSGLKTNNYPLDCTKHQSLAVDDLGLIKVYYWNEWLYGLEFYDREGRSLFRNGIYLEDISPYEIQIKPNERLVGMKCKFEGQGNSLRHFQFLIAKLTE